MRSHQLLAPWRRMRLRNRPAGLTRRQRRNFFYTQMDALGVGLVMAVTPFLAVFLTRLGATNQQVGLLSAIPGMVGLFLGLAMAGFLQTRRNIVPWYSGARFIRLLTYGGVGLAALLLPAEYAISAILVMVLISSIPQALLSVAFSVMMNAIAGPEHRFTLLSRRWSTIAIIGAVMTLVVGQILDRVPFPLNYEIAFISFASVGAVISLVFSRHIDLPESEPDATFERGEPWMGQISDLAKAIWAEKPYVNIVFKRLVYIIGSHLVIPLFALYYVRELQATDAQISIISTAQRIMLLVGYYLWPRLRKRRGSRFVLLTTTFVMALYPALTAATHQVGVMIVLAGVASVFQAGVNLVFFDKLMETVPEEGGAMFVAVAQTLQALESIVGPLISTWLTAYIGLGGALILGTCFRLAGFGLFFSDRGNRESRGTVTASG